MESVLWACEYCYGSMKNGYAVHVRSPVGDGRHVFIDRDTREMGVRFGKVPAGPVVSLISRSSPTPVGLGLEIAVSVAEPAVIVDVPRETAVPAPLKRGPGRPRKNPLPEAIGA